MGRNVWGNKRNKWGAPSGGGGSADKPRVTAIPADGHYQPNVLYVLTLDGTAREITLNEAAAGLAAEYHMFLEIGAAAPEITWPQGLTWRGGDGPTIVENHTYEIRICEGKAYCEDWGLRRELYEIWYYAPSKVTLYNTTGVASHVFADGRGVLTFNAPVTIVGQTLRGITTITDAKLPGGVTSIDNLAFRDCTGLALTSLPGGVTSIGSNCFYGCTSLALTSLPGGITSIGSNCFYGCTSLALTSLPGGITSIGSNCFYGCTSLALTSLPGGITSIGNNCFYGCTSLALTSLPGGVTSIGSSAFRGCAGLALTSLPGGVTSIGDYAFRDCTSIPYLDIPVSSPPTLGTGSFSNTTFPIRVPAASVETYKAADGWSTYASRIVALP